MSIHLLTEEVTLKSTVDVVGPPGANTETIVRQAMLEQTAIREKIPLLDVATVLYIQDPIYKDNHRWLVGITYKVRTTSLCEFD